MTTHSFTYKDIQLIALGHSGFLFTFTDSQGQEHRLVIDPYLTGNPSATLAPSAVRATDIFLTHGHWDHVGDCVTIATANGCSIWAGAVLGRWLSAQGATIGDLDLGMRVPFRWGNVHSRLAIHGDAVAEDGTFLGNATSLLFTINGVRIYHVGDSALHGDFKIVGEMYKPDIAILPIGGHYTMDVHEAALAAQWLGVHTVIPVHYNTFPAIMADVGLFKTLVEKEGITCPILEAASVLP